MSAAMDRVLEYALQVHYGRLESRDLAPDILRAWDRGVRGSPLDDLLPPELDFEPIVELEREVRATRRRRAPWIVLAAAAAAGIAALAYWLAGPRRAARDEGGAPGRGFAQTVTPPVVDVVPGAGSALAGAEMVDKAQALFRTMIWDDVPSFPTAPMMWEKLASDSKRATVALAGMLSAEPLLWDAIEPAVEKTAAMPDADPYVRAVLIDLLARERSTRAIDVARELWQTIPASFMVEHLVAFAESGAEEFERELAALLEDDIAFPRESRVLPAAYFAAREDDRGREILRAGLDLRQRSADGLPLNFVAALALEDLGDEEAWDASLQTFALELEADFLSGRDDLAFELVVAGELFVALRASGERPPLCDLPVRFDRDLELRKPELTDRDAIRAAAAGVLDAPR